MSGTVEFPEPDQQAADVELMLVMRDQISYPVWEYTEDLPTTRDT